MKLEVGKEYRSRNGERVRIDDEDSHPLYPFSDANGRCYASNGERCVGKHDLISEWNEDKWGRGFIINLALRQLGAITKEGTMTTETEIKKLREQLERLEAVHAAEKKGGAYVPELGDEYSFICSGGIARTVIWGDDEMDNLRLAIGNIYRTREEAEQVVTNRKIHRFLQEQTDFVADWSDSGQGKCCLIYIHNLNRFNYSKWSATSQGAQVYFANYKELETARDAAIEKFGRDNVVSYATVGVM